MDGLDSITPGQDAPAVEAAPAEAVETKVEDDTAVDVVASDDESEDEDAGLKQYKWYEPCQRNALYFLMIGLFANALSYFVGGWVWYNEGNAVPGANGVAFAFWSLFAAYYEYQSYHERKPTDRSTVLATFTLYHMVLAITWISEFVSRDKDQTPAVVYSIYFFVFALTWLYYATTSPRSGVRQAEHLDQAIKDPRQAVLCLILLANAAWLIVLAITAFNNDSWNEGPVKTRRQGGAALAWVLYTLFAMVAPMMNRAQAMLSVFLVHTIEVCVAVFDNAESDTKEGTVWLHFLASLLFAAIVLFDIFSQRAEPVRPVPKPKRMKANPAQVKETELTEAAVADVEAGEAEADATEGEADAAATEGEADAAATEGEEAAATEAAEGDEAAAPADGEAAPADGEEAAAPADGEGEAAATEEAADPAADGEAATPAAESDAAPATTSA